MIRTDPIEGTVAILTARAHRKRYGGAQIEHHRRFCATRLRSLEIPRAPGSGQRFLLPRVREEHVPPHAG